MMPAYVCTPTAVPVQVESSDYIESWYLHEHSQPQVLLAKYKTTPLPCSVMFSRKPWLPCATVGVLYLTSSFSDQCSVLYWCKLCVLLLSPIVLLYETWVTSFALAALALSYLPLELRAYLPCMFFYTLEILQVPRLGSYSTGSLRISYFALKWLKIIFYPNICIWNFCPDCKVLQWGLINDNRKLLRRAVFAEMVEWLKAHLIKLASLVQLARQWLWGIHHRQIVTWVAYRWWT